jgi:hypothetical protein
MFLNARYNQFKFFLPKDFLYRSVEEKYEDHLKQMSVPYKSVIDFLNSTIKSITFPGVQGGGTVTQYQAAKRVNYRQAFKFNQIVNRDFTVTFRMVDAYLNYWLMYEQLMKYTNYEDEDVAQQLDVPLINNEFFPDFEVQYLTSDGEVGILQRLRQIVYTGISDLTPSYNDISNATRDFTCRFSFNYLELQVHPMSYDYNNMNIYK